MDIRGRTCKLYSDIERASTPINANQIESLEYEARSQINRIKAS